MVAIFERRTFRYKLDRNGYLPLLARSLTFTRPPCPARRRLSSYSPPPLCPRPPHPPSAVSPLSLGGARGGCEATASFARQCLLEDLFQYFQLKLDKSRLFEITPACFAALVADE